MSRFGIPRSKTVTLLSGLGTCHPNDTLSVLAEMLSRKGYSLVNNGPASVETLLSINGDGVFYLQTHGGPAVKVVEPITDLDELPRSSTGVVLDGPKTKTEFGLWTSTEATLANLPQYDNYLLEGSLCLMGGLPYKNKLGLLESFVFGALYDYDFDPDFPPTPDFPGLARNPLH